MNSPTTPLLARRRRRGLLALATATMLVLAGCASGSNVTNDTSPTVVSVPAEEDALPVTLQHAFGETTIKEAPERVVTIGWASHDIVAALGTIPVGQPQTWGGDEEGFSPWFRDHVESLDGTMPEILAYNDSNELDFEQVLALEPDLIVAPHSGVTETDYERLSEIAPTLAYTKQPWASGAWQDLIRIVGQALGQPARAEELVTETMGLMKAAAAEHPEFAETTFAYGLTLSDGTTELGIYIPSDARVQFLLDLGLSNTPAMAQVVDSVEGDDWFGAVSLEELDTLPADIFVAWSNGPEELAYTLDHPTFKLWEPISAGRYLFLEDSAIAMATNAPTPLSVPWALDRFIPALASAIAGNAGK